MHISKRLKRGSLILAAVVLGGLALMTIVSAFIYSPAYLYRAVVNGESKTTDYLLFPERKLPKSETPYNYPEMLDETILEQPLEWEAGGETISGDLQTLVEGTNTTSLLIIQDDQLVLEYYSVGRGQYSINTSFSMAKSVTSLLIGLAIEEGYIESEEQSIADYIVEFRGTEMADISIADLLLMRSPIYYEEGGPFWFGHDTYTYYMPDIRSLALGHTRVTDKYRGRFHYNNYHPQYLGIILERATGQSVTDFMAAHLWGKLGPEYEASWSLDSEDTGFEKMESGINFRSIDFIKLGSMVLHNGQWNGEQIMDAGWLERSMQPVPYDPEEYQGTFLQDTGVCYGYMWYSLPNSLGGIDVFAWGKYGQFLYISPENNTVILRTGSSDGGVDSYGDVDNWPQILSELSERTGER